MPDKANVDVYGVRDGALEQRTTAKRPKQFYTASSVKWFGIEIYRFECV